MSAVFQGKYRTRQGRCPYFDTCVQQRRLIWQACNAQETGVVRNALARSPSRDLAKIKVAALGPKSGFLGAAALARDASSGEYLLG
jgi:hypothetical protein